MRDTEVTKYKFKDKTIFGKHTVEIKEYALEIASNYYKGELKESGSLQYGYRLVDTEGKTISELERKVFKKNGVWCTAYYSFQDENFLYKIKFPQPEIIETEWSIEIKSVNEGLVTIVKTNVCEIEKVA